MQAATDSVEGKWQKSLALWEVASVISSCLIAEWVVLAFVGRNKLVMAIPVGLALILMAISFRERGETLRDLGWRLDNFLAALRVLLVPTLVAVLLTLGFAYFLTQGLTFKPWRNRFITLPLWALFQQFVLNAFINRRLQFACGKGATSILLVGLAFGLMHLPNPLLALITLIGGVIWAWAYQRQPNLFALALSHSIVSLTLTLAFPANLLNSLRVGFKYFG